MTHNNNSWVLVLSKCSAEFIIPLVGSVTVQFSPITGWIWIGQAAYVDHRNLYVQLSVADTNSGVEFCKIITYKTHAAQVGSNLTNPIINGTYRKMAFCNKKSYNIIYHSITCQCQKCENAVFNNLCKCTVTSKKNVTTTWQKSW